MNKSVKPQEEFPYLNSYRLKFPITEDTVFVYDNNIYANNELPYDIMAHEITHINQQNKIGAKKWIKNYLKDSNFRLQQELEAYKAQLKTVKNTGDREEYNQILIESSRNISSTLYGELITQKQFIDMFNWKKI